MNWQALTPNWRTLTSLRMCFLAAAAVLLLTASASAQLPNVPLIDPFEPASNGGLEALDRSLGQLTHHRRLLVLAAHPDDEDTMLLTLVARGMDGQAAYLSLSRGDGGQNLIGSEVGPALGLLRSRELESARRIDGARQFFTRAYDFGFTRSIDETLERWPKEVLLEDAMRVVRRFKPQVLMAVFPPSADAGHGQHWASGIVAEEIYALSQETDSFPELTAEGLAPWRIHSFYRGAWWRNAEGAPTLTLPLDAIEPFSGRSIFQLALASRSQHRCQDMGMVQPLGYAADRLRPVAGVPADAEELFAGVDTSLPAIADALPAGELRRGIAVDLDRVSQLARSARAAISPADRSGAVEPLAAMTRLLQGIQGQLLAQETPAAGSQHVEALVSEKLGIAYEALANAASVFADGVSEQELVVVGDRIKVRSLFWNASSTAVEDLQIDVVSEAGWRAVDEQAAEAKSARFATQLTDEREWLVEVPSDSLATMPYFHRLPRQGDLYDWSAASVDDRGLPFEAAPLSLRFRFRVAGARVELDRQVVFRRRDQARGEVRRPLRAVPALEVSLARDLVVWPIGAQASADVEVAVRSHRGEAVQGSVALQVPPGWPTVAPQTLDIRQPHGLVSLRFEVRPPADLAPGNYRIRASAKLAGQEFDRQLMSVDYPHIRPVVYPQVAEMRFAAGHIVRPELNRIGYVRGASDRLPELLTDLGLAIEVLDSRGLEAADLSAYDAIVVGSRAFEIDDTLAGANGRLLEYARAGGLLIVQYQQYQFVRGGHPPLPLEIHRPHDRVTDETAVVRLLEPQHAVFQQPNRLAEADWQGWVQERGLYFAGTWDPGYRPLLAMADPGGEEKLGGLLIAEIGEGTYVYTGLAFFRQLPAGVTGAYRLLMNLLAL